MKCDGRETKKELMMVIFIAKDFCNNIQGGAQIFVATNRSKVM